MEQEYGRTERPYTLRSENMFEQKKMTINNQNLNINKEFGEK